jgi:hypothetical protein
MIKGKLPGVANIRKNKFEHHEEGNFYDTPRQRIKNYELALFRNEGIFIQFTIGLIMVKCRLK